MELAKKSTRISEAMRSSILQNSLELFSKYGYKKTTMEDIAATLKRGKSSLYYYYKCKEDIFLAVLEKEETVLFSKLQEVVDSPLKAQDKLKQYVLVRMNTLRDLENYQKALKEQLFEGFDIFQAMVRNSERKEMTLILEIINQGLASDEFSLHSPEMAASGIATALKGLEMPLFRGDYESIEDFNQKLEHILNILFFGLLKR